MFNTDFPEAMGIVQVIKCLKIVEKVANRGEWFGEYVAYQVLEFQLKIFKTVESTQKRTAWNR